MSLVDRIKSSLCSALVRHGSMAKARKEVEGVALQLPDSVLDQAVQELLLQQQEFLGNSDAVIQPDDCLHWYHGPPACSPRWQAYVRNLQASGWLHDDLTRLDHSTSKTTDLLPPPGNLDFAGRGLVVGRVQSGKTAHFTGLAAKAADSGYRLVIVLAGLTNLLRKQTQERLNHDLGFIDGRWHPLTHDALDGDFERPPQEAAASVLTNPGLISIAVVKKNTDVLEKLTRWIGGAGTGARASCPTLVIDDEADQASVNTTASMQAEDLARINGLIIHLLGLLPRCCLVGYTATPFANVLIHPGHPENLYPSSFITDLEPPPAYIGVEAIHGRARLTTDEDDEETDGGRYVETIPESELPDLRPARMADRAGFHFHPTPSLRSALRWFMMACAARLHRASAGGPMVEAGSMLIHTSNWTAVHRSTAAALPRVLADLDLEMAEGSLASWEALWSELNGHIVRTSSMPGAVHFPDLSGWLAEVRSGLDVVVLNSDPESGIPEEGLPRFPVFVGGNVLSRGLTLKGLTVSYFARTANAYDTVMQMGRWFGYRPGYEDLPRIWMPPGMQDAFHSIAATEAEVHEQIRRMERMGTTPLQAAVRIRRLPGLQVTAANKRRWATDVEVSYGGERPQTIHFLHKDRDWLSHNLEASRRLLLSLGAPDTASSSRYVWRSMPVTAVLGFLNDYKVHSSSRTLSRELVSGYIRSRNGKSALLHWNIVVLGRETEDPTLGTLMLLPGMPVHRIKRCRMNLGHAGDTPSTTANIKTLMAPQDIIADLPAFPPGDDIQRDRDALFRLRSGDPHGVLILYPVSPRSTPSRAGGTRLPLDAVDEVIGMAMVFPPVLDQQEGDWIAVRLPGSEPDPEDDA